MSDQAPSPAKPGYASTEFYMSGGAAALLAPLLQDPDPWARGAGSIALAVVAVGYAWLRTKAKAQ